VNATEPLLTIGEVAARAGIRASQIRYYEQVDVLPAPRRVSGQRRYDEEVLKRLSIIDVAQRAGFSLDEIRTLTGSENRAPEAPARVRAVVDERLPQIDALIERATAVRRWLVAAQDCDCTSIDVCSLFVDPQLAPPPDRLARRRGLRTDDPLRFA